MLTFPYSIPFCYFGGAVDTISPNLPILAYEAMKLTVTMTAVVLCSSVLARRGYALADRHVT
jgi:hypothetical protein